MPYPGPQRERKPKCFCVFVFVFRYLLQGTTTTYSSGIFHVCYWIINWYSTMYYSSTVESCKSLPRSMVVVNHRWARSSTLGGVNAPMGVVLLNKSREFFRGGVIKPFLQGGYPPLRPPMWWMCFVCWWGHYCTKVKMMSAFIPFIFISLDQVDMKTNCVSLHCPFILVATYVR